LGLSAWKSSSKVDNNPQAQAAKIAIRRNVLAAIDPASVFDAFAGTGVMFRGVWSGAKYYMACLSGCHTQTLRATRCCIMNQRG